MKDAVFALLPCRLHWIILNGNVRSVVVVDQRFVVGIFCTKGSIHHKRDVQSQLDCPSQICCGSPRNSLHTFSCPQGSPLCYPGGHTWQKLVFHYSPWTCVPVSDNCNIVGLLYNGVPYICFVQY